MTKNRLPPGRFVWPARVVMLTGSTTNEWTGCYYHVARSSPEVPFSFLAWACNEPDWLSAALESLKSAGILQTGWDGYAAEPPSQLAIEESRRLIESLHSQGIRVSQLAASVVGGIGISMEGNGPHEAYVEVYNDGRIYLMLSDETRQDVIPVRPSEHELRAAVDQIGEYLNGGNPRGNETQWQAYGFRVFPRRVAVSVTL